MPRYLPENRFLGATSMRPGTAGLEGIHWEAAFLVGMPPLSRVFQVAHVKPANTTNRLCGEFSPAGGVPQARPPGLGRVDQRQEATRTRPRTRLCDAL
jgi:hypothetical protein